MFLSVDRCGCERAIGLYCWLLSGKLLAGERKTRSVGNLLIETMRATKIAGCQNVVARA